MAMARTGSELAAPEAATQAKSAPAVIASRRHDLDWHRIAAVPMLIPYHISRAFDIWQPF